MRRREILRVGVSMIAAAATGGARSQTGPVTRAAVVIGVDRPRNMPPLGAAVSGANKVADWLHSEGFQPVRRFTDTTGPVKAADVFDSIAELVDLGTLQQLVVYFAGHGCFVGTGEYWLLSEALRNPNEAISVNECVVLSRQCGIPNVVLISDACRSTSASLGVQALHGYVIFPIKSNSNVFTYLDRFFASRIGAPAYEVRDTAGAYNGIYTSCFLDAYVNPSDTMVDNADGQKVIRNKKLEIHLLQVVPQAAMMSDIQQYPDSIVTSPNYIGHAEYRSRAAQRVPLRKPSPAETETVPATMNDIAEFRMTSLGLQLGDATSKKLRANDLEQATKDTGFDAIQDLILKAREPDLARYDTAILVFGARLRAAIAATMECEILHKGNGSPNEPAVAQLAPRGKRQDTVAVEFEDGSGTVIAALQKHVAKIVVHRGGVLSVSYESALRGEQWKASRSTYQRLIGLQAAVATSAHFGALRIDGPRDIRSNNAQHLADAIRSENLIDPTLALYAAYAYADAGLYDQIRPIREAMKAELELDLFDIALLSGTLSPGIIAESPAPFCPMLNQGWQYLRTKNVTLPPKLAAARDHIIPSLWTTFDPKGMSIVKAALGLGNLR